MGVKVIDRKYKNQFHENGENVDWLLGNVGDWQRLELTFEVTIEFKASSSETIAVNADDNTLKLNNGRSWQDYGFDIGDTILFFWDFLADPDNDGNYTETSHMLTFTAINMYGDTMETDADFDFGPYNLFPTDRGSVKIANVKVQTFKVPEGMKFRYSHITNENHESDNLNSIIDGTTTEFSFAGLNNLVPNVPVLMNPDGMQSGMAIEKCQIQKINPNTDNEYSEVFYVNPTTFRCQTSMSMFAQYILNWTDKQAVSIPMTKQMNNPMFQNPQQGVLPMNVSWGAGNAGTYAQGYAPQCFLFNSSYSGLRFFDLSLDFRITGTNDNSNDDKVNLVMIRYTGGVAMTPVQRTVLHTWENAENLEDQILSLSDMIMANTGLGDSLCLALEYEHTPQVGVNRYVDINVIVCDFKPVDFEDVEEATVHTYKLTCDFMLASIFEEVSNLEDRIAPSSLFDAGSLTDNFELIVYPEWNNPNTVIRNNMDHTERLGNTGWFDENFNGLDNNFEVESLKYFNTEGQQIDQLDFASDVIVEAVVAGIENLSTNSEFGLGFSWIPQEPEDYKHKETPFHKNLLINTARKFIGGSFNLGENTGTTIFEGNSFGEAKMNIQADENVMFTSAGDGKVKMRAVLKPNTAFYNFFNNREENDRKYILWISTANHDLQINFSDRVTTLLDYNDMKKSIPPAGPLPGLTNSFMEHPQEHDVQGVGQYVGHIEDDILSRVNFKIDKTEKVIKTIGFGYEIENLDEETSYRLEDIALDVSNIPADSNGVQQIEIDQLRGFKTEVGNNKNWLKVQRNENGDNGDDVAYTCYFATKLRWESWLSRNGVPEEFYNPDLPNNGYHNNWLDYLRANGNYSFNFFVEIIVEEEGELKAYKNPFPINFNGYDENLNIETEHHYFRHSDDTNIDVGTDPITGKPLGVLLNNEKTRIEITYTNLSGNFDFQKLYCVTSLEIDKGVGRPDYRQLSSVWGSESDNPLIPLENETKLKVIQIAPNVAKAVCLVEPTLLQEASRYKITGRIGCFKEGTGEESRGIYGEAYSVHYQ